MPGRIDTSIKYCSIMKNALLVTPYSITPTILGQSWGVVVEQQNGKGVR